MSSAQKRPYIAVLRFVTSVVLWVAGVVLLAKAAAKEAGSRDQILFGALGAAAAVAALLNWAIKWDAAPPEE
jgi:hypothetical protein